MDIVAVFQTWHIGDGNYPPLEKEQLVNLSFELEEIGSRLVRADQQRNSCILEEDSTGFGQEFSGNTRELLKTQTHRSSFWNHAAFDSTSVSMARLQTIFGDAPWFKARDTWPWTATTGCNSWSGTKTRQTCSTS